jgi:hypothetical protein
MQQPQALPSSVKTSLIYGLIFGGIIGVIDIAYTGILDATSPPFQASLFQALSSLNIVLANIIF